MTWFTKLTGIDEESPELVRREISVEGEHLICPGGKRIAFGRLETPKLAELRQAVAHLNPKPKRTTICEVVGDVRKLHADPANANALFQVASQFNLLEMTGPSVTPERGVGIYENDPTQGPACAIACGAGTIYRNYFTPVGDSIGQNEHNQIDCSFDLGRQLDSAGDSLWTMRNGYLFPTDAGLQKITTKLQDSSEDQLNDFRGELRIGLQWEADVTLPGASHKVSQAYCSALPVAYGRHPTETWADFAKLILDAAYEATFCAAVLNASRTGNSIIYLTLLGGGVFGNRDEWIIAAIQRAFQLHRQHGLDIRIVSYGHSQTAVAELAQRLGTHSPTRVR
ncbi:hypothetical protein [Rhodopirellula sp. SWK7]|uniref:hypothetical protein n=1 Tax=Rhodopirellula sp. SWK7 TaxID=595460 RepID=UPI0002BE7D00|nr:hypothetical protein [Rhodopirellula sp. SWK7]EMI40836.1 hypothetical protein RRSWK_06659 [Rhodopirellula sp. SWK7]